MKGFLLDFPSADEIIAKEDIEMTSFYDLIHERRSVRSYNEKPVPKELIERAIEAARLAPSAHNSQPWKFIVVDNEAIKNRIAAACTSPRMPINKFVPRAPVIVAVISERKGLLMRLASILKRREFHMIDLGIAAEHFCLQAHDDGLGTCMIGWFSERKVKKLLKVPFGRRVHLLISLGFTDDTKIRTKRRKAAEEVLSYNRY